MPRLDPAAELARLAANHEWHFRKRIRERFGLKVSPERYRRWCRLVIDVGPGVKPAGSQGPDRSVWVVRLGGHEMRVVLDARTECLVTCLPLHEQQREQRAASLAEHRQKLRRLRRAGK